MKMSKSMRSLGIFFVAALMLSCNFIGGVENNYPAPIKAFEGTGSIQMSESFPLGPQNTYTVNYKVCADIDGKPGCTDGDIPIDGLPIRTIFTAEDGSESTEQNNATDGSGRASASTPLGEIINITIQEKLDENGNVERITHFGGIREIFYPPEIILKTKLGDLLLCSSKFYFGDFEWKSATPFDNYSLTYGECYPTKKTSIGNRKEGF